MIVIDRRKPQDQVNCMTGVLKPHLPFTHEQTGVYFHCLAFVTLLQAQVPGSMEKVPQ
jgi:hypothetical protein